MAAGILGVYISSMMNLLSLDIEDTGVDAYNWGNLLRNLRMPCLASVTFMHDGLEDIEEEPDAMELNADQMAAFLRRHPTLEVIDHQFPSLPVLHRIFRPPPDFLAPLALYIGNQLDIVYFLNRIRSSIAAIDVTTWQDPSLPDESWKLNNPRQTSIELLILDIEYIRVGLIPVDGLTTH